MIDPVTRAAAAKALTSQPGCVLLPSCWDAGLARLFTAMGFPGLETTSAELAYSLGRPDGLNGVTREETLANARVILGATHLPVFADLENGFGDSPEDVAETIRLAVAVGLSGGSIEDSTGLASPPLYPMEEAVARISAAVTTAQGRFHVTARCEGLQRQCLDLAGVIERLRAYAAAGADAVYAPGLSCIGMWQSFAPPRRRR